MSEPAIISYGREHVDDYTPDEFMESLRSAFVKNGSDYIILDGFPHGQRFLAACAAWALDGGLLYNDHNSDDGQQVVSSFRLTPKGREALALF